MGALRDRFAGDGIPRRGKEEGKNTRQPKVTSGHGFGRRDRPTANRILAVLHGGRGGLLIKRKKSVAICERLLPAARKRKKKKVREPVVFALNTGKGDYVVKKKKGFPSYPEVYE